MCWSVRGEMSTLVSSQLRVWQWRRRRRPLERHRGVGTHRTSPMFVKPLSHIGEPRRLCLPDSITEPQTKWPPLPAKCRLPGNCHGSREKSHLIGYLECLLWPYIHEFGSGWLRLWHRKLWQLIKTLLIAQDSVGILSTHRTDIFYNQTEYNIIS